MTFLNFQKLSRNFKISVYVNYKTHNVIQLCSVNDNDGNGEETKNIRKQSKAEKSAAMSIFVRHKYGKLANKIIKIIRNCMKL